MNTTLWIIQALLAALFIFAGGAKLIMPIEEMTAQMPIALPGWFLRFTAVAELLGGIGLVLPWLTRIKPNLTSLAAAGLVIIMIGATVVTLMTGQIAFALFPLVTEISARSLLTSEGPRPGTRSSHEARGGRQQLGHRRSALRSSLEEARSERSACFGA